MVGDEVRRLGLIRFVNTLYVFTRSFTFVLYVVEKQRFFFKKRQIYDKPYVENYPTKPRDR